MNYINVTYPDINNGLGFRVTLWVAGCSHHCPGCHNSWTWDYNIGKKLEECKEELFKALALPYIKGLTLSGGDPLSQNDENLKELRDLVSEVKEKFPNKDIWIYAGDKLEYINTVPLKKEIVDMCDYLVDGTFHMNERDLSIAFRGSRNQRIWHATKDGWEQIDID